MNKKRIKKLRIRFLLISFISMTLAMLMVTGLILVSNHFLTRRNVKNVLQYIVDHEGDLPGARDIENSGGEISKHDYSVVRFLNEIFNPELLLGDADKPEFYYSNRYFAILYDENDRIENVITNHTAVVSEEEASIYGEAALNDSSGFGRYASYYYQVADRTDGGKIVVYLDSSEIISANTRFLYVTLGMIFFGVLTAAIFTVKFSKWAILSEIRNMEAQKGFITNASHELKTPLAVIRANTEMQEMISGGNEWTESTTRQVDRMLGLIQNLVMIARAEEYEADAVTEDCDVSAAIADTAKNFEPVAVNEGKSLETELEENVHMKAMDSQIRQLASLLIDNAIKYCDEGGMIRVGLSRKGKTVLLEVSNDYLDGKGKDCSKFFERFYREDESHNIDKGGYGIGLSIAESIVKVYHGSIDASWNNGRINFICRLSA